MGSKVKKTNNIPRVVKSMSELSGKNIQVGIFGEDNYKYGNDADLATIARVHEFGADIKPVKSNWLTVPIIPEAKGKKASDFGDSLFFVPGKSDDYAFLARKKGKGIERVFLLSKDIKIPERAFLRGAFDNNVKNINKSIKLGLANVVSKGVNVDSFLDAIGMQLAGDVQKYMRSLKNPPNSPLTISTKRSSNPLMDTGRLVGAIRHKIE